MSEQNNHVIGIAEMKTDFFWLTRPPPCYRPPQPMAAPIGTHLNYQMPPPLFVRPHMPPRYPLEPNPMPLPYSRNNSNLNYQDRFVPSYKHQSMNNSIPPLPDNIDADYVLKYVCPLKKYPLKDETDVWIDNWLAGKKEEITMQPIKSFKLKINEISDKVKECKILLEQISNSKQFMEQNMSTMTTAEWKEACSNLFSIKGRLDTLLQFLNLDDCSMSELNFKLNKRRRKRDRLKRLKSNLNKYKSQQNDEIKEIHRKIDVWQNTIKENILKEKRANKTKVEANIVLKGVRGKIDDAKNQISLIYDLDKLRQQRLMNCVDKRKNPALYQALITFKTFWLKKLSDYTKEEEELKNMLSKAETEKHEKREMEIHEKLSEWDKLFFGPNFRSHEIIIDNLHTFLDIRRDWDKYVVNEKETPPPASSSIPVGWILPSAPCNSDWAKYLKQC